MQPLMKTTMTLRQQETSTTGRLIACTAIPTRWIFTGFLLAFCLAITVPVFAQVNSSVHGRVTDATGAVIPSATVTAVNVETGVSRSTTGSATGDYSVTLLPPGDYTVTAEHSGFQKSAKKVHLDIGAAANVDFSLAVGQVTQEVSVQDIGEVAEPTRTMVSSVIDEQKIQDLPVNGRQFIDFALLAPGVKIGDTTSGSTDVIIEPVTKLSFAGQNIHYNFIAVDGADNISTASGVQKYTPSQEAVREFRVINQVTASSSDAPSVESSTSSPRAAPIISMDLPTSISETTSSTQAAFSLLPIPPLARQAIHPAAVKN